MLWRFRLLVAAGVVLGTSLAVLSLFSLRFEGGTPSFEARDHDVWLSASTLFVTQEGFPWGRSILDETVPLEGGGDDAVVPRYGDPGRYAGLAALYVELAKSDPVRRAVLAGAPANVSYEPEVVKSSDGGSVLPMMYMKGYGPSPAEAEGIADKAADAFKAYLARQQVRNGIPVDKRVEVVITSRAIPAEIFEPRSLVRPLFVFLLFLMASVAAAFVLENLRPSARRAAIEVHPASPRAPERSAAAQRSA